jgi:predicted NBD/HSP70 family sugar kinase
MIFLPARMGLLNRRALIRQMERAGVASRAGVARALGMSQPTAGKIVEELLTEKILEEVVATEDALATTTLGRPGRQLRLNRARPGFLGIQLGIRQTDLFELALDPAAEPLRQESFYFPAGGSNPGRAWGQALRSFAAKVRASDIRCVVLSVPGVVDESARRILFSPNVHWSEGADLPALVQRVWPVPVLLVQEERALALGHHRQQPGHEDFLLVDFGDGVGGAILVGGKPFAGPLPISGELGHTPVPGNLRKCGCGAIGCVETLVSARALLEGFAQAHPRKKRDWASLRAHLQGHGVEPWLAQALHAAAFVIAGSLNVLGLRRVVITGVLSELPPAVIAELSSAIKQGAMWARFGDVECVVAPRQRAAGMVAVGIDRFIAPEPGLASAGHLTS